MTTKTKRPIVLTIDDDDQGDTKLKLRSSATVIAKTPDEVTFSDLRRAHVVLVDYQIEEWKGRDNAASIALQPRNGVALAAVLRSQVEDRTQDDRRAFAIHSAKLNDLSGGLPPPDREHAIARTLNLEWAFPKTQSGNGPSINIQVAALAAAVRGLPKTWPDDIEKTQKLVTKLLAAPPKRAWRDRAADDVASCHPPIQAWAATTNGMVFLRWLLHQVLPYPSFLLEERYVAARLYVTVESLRKALKSESKVRRALRPFEYTGVLSTFLGDRWWRAGIDHALWDWTEGDPFNAESVGGVVHARLSESLVPVNVIRPVVCVDAQSFRPTDAVVDIAQAVEIKPDDWPAYAEQAWIAREQANDEGIAGLVVPQDRERIEGAQ